jgi:hypothetical protein
MILFINFPTEPWNDPWPGNAAQAALDISKWKYSADIGENRQDRPEEHFIKTVLTV